MEKLRKAALKMQIIVGIITVLLSILCFTKIIPYQVALCAIVLCIFISIFNLILCIKGLNNYKKK